MTMKRTLTIGVLALAAAAAGTTTDPGERAAHPGAERGRRCFLLVAIVHLRNALHCIRLRNRR